MFFITTTVSNRRSYGEAMTFYGLDLAMQRSALAHRHNNHLRINNQPAAPNHRPVHTVSMVIPIDVRLHVVEFRAVVNTATGIQPRLVGTNSPPVYTHGVSTNIDRNLSLCPGLNWLQTVTKLNNPTPNQPRSFVDLGGNQSPFVDDPPTSRAHIDTPCGPVAPSPGRGIDFSATTTLALLYERQIILTRGKTWGYRINTATTLSAGVTLTHPRDATPADFMVQLNILRAGINQFGDSTGRHRSYIPPPRDESILTF
jgi:hypothetical protein